MQTHRLQIAVVAWLLGVSLTLTGCQTTPPPRSRPAFDGVSVRTDPAGNVSVQAGDTRVNVRTSDWRGGSNP